MVQRARARLLAVGAGLKSGIIFILDCVFRRQLGLEGSIRDGRWLAVCYRASNEHANRGERHGCTVPRSNGLLSPSDGGPLSGES